VTEVPDGIDPGWAYNPGKSGYRALKAAEKLIDASPDLAATFNDAPDWLAKPVGEEFSKWFDEASAGNRVDQTIVVAGTMSREVLTTLRSRDIEPASGAITISQRAVRHIIRDQKAARRQNVPTDLLRQIPALLSKPKAVLRDTRDNSLLYVFDLPDDIRQGKLVVRLDYQEKARPSGSKPQKIKSNSIRTAGAVELRALTDQNAYELLMGEL
jgi:hypothetical protein